MAAITISASTTSLTCATSRVGLKVHTNICNCMVIMAVRAITVFCIIVNQCFLFIV